MIKVSIIIPAFNVETYIKRAIESCINQTYTNIEIIIIDDGSTDDTFHIIKKYALIDSRIKVISQNNKGVSNARNSGIKNVKGDYVCFLDSDDWLENNAIETFINDENKKEGYLNSYCCQEVYLCNEKVMKKETLKTKKNTILEKEEALEACCNLDYHLQSSCYKFFSMSIIRKYNLSFKEEIYYGEDGLFVFEYLYYQKGIIYQEKKIWNVLSRENSATTLPFNSKNITALDVYNHLIKLDVSDNVKKAMHSYFVNKALIVLHKAIESTPIPKRDIKRIRQLLKKFEYKSNYSRQLYLFIMEYCPIIILHIYFIRNKRW